MLDHRLSVWSLDDHGVPQGEPVHVSFDGPLWSFDAQTRPAGPNDRRPLLRVVLGGVEDHPLDRRDGAFGHVDSFAYVVDLPSEGAPVRRAEINLGTHGAVTPKWVDLQVGDDDTTVVHAVGYGGDVLVTARWDASFGEPTVSTRTVVPGISDVVFEDEGRRGVAVSPLLDAVVRWDDDDLEVIAEPGAPDTEVRLGEALAFTGLMGPAATSEGKRSRFTCETCHFEGLVDGRVHFTGRAQVHATTRTLRGLFNNRPHFSRALDPTMATMAHNEFDVASRGTPGDPWFTVSPQQTPWLTHLGVTESLGPEALRRALMRFLMEFTPEPNPAVAGRVEELEAVRAAFSSGAVRSSLRRVSLGTIGDRRREHPGEPGSLAVAHRRGRAHRLGSQSTRQDRHRALCARGWRARALAAAAICKAPVLHQWQCRHAGRGARALCTRGPDASGRGLHAAAGRRSGGPAGVHRALMMPRI